VELESALRFCELHGLELLPDSVDVVHGCIDYADWYIKARNQLFPHAASEPISTEGNKFEVDRVGVWYCIACRQAEAEWRKERKD
jgi:hypothetical protein